MKFTSLSAFPAKAEIQGEHSLRTRSRFSRPFLLSLDPRFRGGNGRAFWAAILFIVFGVVSAHAGDNRETGGGDPRAGVWGLDPQATSAELARGGWKYLGMSTLSWPDGRQAVVTMWSSKLGDFARCFDYFDAEMRQTGGKCERSGTGL
jgi:hypothetical protein